MKARTDLAIETTEEFLKNADEISQNEKKIENITVTETEILSDIAAEKTGKEKGKYITLSFPDLEKMPDYDTLKNELKKALSSLIQNGEKILVVGLGNSEITADSIGPKTASKLLATRHIAGEFAEQIGLSNLHSVSVLSTGVLGKTGIESAELCAAVSEKIRPTAVVVIDALAAADTNRLFRTIQLSNTGISPGSGVKNSRKELSEKTLGVPVVAVGVPTVVDALNLAKDGDIDLVLTPKDCDLLSHRITEILANALNIALQPEIDEEIILSLV